MTDQRSPSPATVCMVTGYITLNSAHKRHEAYLRWGERLLSDGVPTIAFFDRPWDHEVFEQVDDLRFGPVLLKARNNRRDRHGGGMHKINLRSGFHRGQCCIWENAPA